MQTTGTSTRTLRVLPGRLGIEVLDQTALPDTVRWVALTTLADVARAIAVMQVRGAPLIGATAAYGVAIALGHDAGDLGMEHALAELAATRPTAVNLGWALRRMGEELGPLPPHERAAAAWGLAEAIAQDDVATNRAIGEHGLRLLRETAARALPGPALPDRALLGDAVQVMTHCNAGWLATVDHGTALAPVYAAWDAGLPVHVWVSETRPRNQGLLTAWELAQHGVPHTVVADSACGVLLARGEVDLVIVGADRVAANGDVANKVGTYLKALACRDTGVGFYVAVPGSTIDFGCATGEEIPIEERDGEELRCLRGLDRVGGRATVRQLPQTARVENPAFDVTPARLVTAVITERGVCAASADGLRGLYPR